MQQAKLKHANYWQQPAADESESARSIFAEPEQASPHMLGAVTPTMSPSAGSRSVGNAAFTIGLCVFAGMIAAAIVNQLPPVAGILAAMGLGVALLLRWGFWVLDNIQ